ncbi:MAG: YceI family protein [Saprospiraceae bacterium]
MRNLIVLLALCGVALAACGDTKPAGGASEAATPPPPSVPNEVIYVVDPQASIVRWKGTEPIGDGHYGMLRLSKGALRFEESRRLVGGEFTLDMNSLEVEDLSGSQKAKLESHLKDGDFFETNKYPQASFEITGVNPTDGNGSILIEGNLTMREITRPLRFPATLRIDGGELSAETPEFEIDRTQWNVTYRSGLIGTLKNKLIDDAIKLRIQLKGNKQ